MLSLEEGASCVLFLVSFVLFLDNDEDADDDRASSQGEEDNV